MLDVCPYHQESSNENRAEVWDSLHNAIQASTMALTTQVHARRDELDEYASSLFTEEKMYDLQQAGQKPFREFALHGARGRFTRATLAPLTTTRFESVDYSPLTMPIGRNDEENVHRSTGIIAWMAGILESDPVWEQIAEQAETYAAAIRHHTFLGTERTTPAEALLVALQQGVVTIAHAMRLLTVEVPPAALEDTERQLVRGQKIEKFARRIGSSSVSTLIQHARYIEQPLTQSGDFSPGLCAYMSYTRKAARQMAVGFRMYESASRTPDVFVHLVGGGGMTCPATKGPIQQLSELMVAAKYDF